MLTWKYRPRLISDIVGNDKAKSTIIKWISSWLHNKPQKPLFLYGSPGIGKTSMAYAIANQHHMDILEISASDMRDKRHIDRVVRGALTASTLTGRRRLILIDDVDAITRDDRGGLSELVKLLKSPKTPVIITAQDIWDPKLSSLRSIVIPVEMKRVAPSDVEKLLKKIVEKEGFNVPNEKIHEIAVSSKGDVRSALNDLESMVIGRRDRKEDVFDVLKLIFKTMKFSAARYASVISDIDPDTLKLWISENIPYEYEKPHEVAMAFDMLSRADIFDGRIKRRQYWGFLRYSMTLMTAGIALSKDDVYRKFTKYHFPTYLRLMSKTVSSRALFLSICKKIGKKLHISPKRVMEDISFYLTLISKDMDRAKIYYRFTDNEVEFIKNYLSL